MALNEPSSQSPETQSQSTSQAAAVPQHASTESSNSGGSPVWVVPLYMLGLALLFLGQRVLVEFDRGKLIASGLGLGALLAATAARFVLGSRASQDRKRIEVLLGLLSVTGLLAIALYFASTDGGIDKIGFAAAAREYKDKVQGVLQVAWVVLLCLSTLPMLFAEAALYPMRRGPELEVRRVAAAAASGATLAFAAAYGALFVFSASVSTVQADFSYFKTSDPGESTIKMVESLDAPLKVTAFFPEVNEVRRELAGYFAKLAKHSKKIEFSFHDRYLEPKLAKDLKISADGTVVLEKGEAKRVIVLGTDMKTVQPKLKTWDKEFQGLLNKVIRSNRTAFMTVGHGELNDEKKGISRNQGRAATIFKQILQQQNYVVRNLGLTDGLGSKVPDDAAIVMVLGPLEPFAPEEIATLRRYVDGGGSVFFAFDTDAFESNESAVDTTAATDPKAQIAPASNNDQVKPAKSPLTTSIEQLVGLVGLTFDGSVLANQVRHMQRAGNESDNIILMTNRFSSHASVSTLSRNASQAAVVMLGANALDKASSAKTERVDFTLRSLTGTFPDKNRNFRQEKAEEPDNIFNMGAAVAKAVEKSAAESANVDPAAAGAGGAADKDANKATAKEMRAFVLADADAISDLLMGNFPSNRMMVFDAVRWLGGEESFTGEVNTEEDVRIEHSQQKDLAWFYGTIFGVPGLVLAGGLIVSRRSRQSKGGKK
jgi:hypothetical protein